ncbi:MAG: hypothetical protein ACJAYC_003033 [Halieaceae bacterium]|jgi:hypothetical protein
MDDLLGTDLVESTEIQLDPLYYVHNFLRLCDSVESQYADLLSAGELDFVQCLQGLPQAPLCLYVRLVSRVGPLFRLSKLSYRECGDIEIAAKVLVDAGLLQRVTELKVEQLGQLFTRSELYLIYSRQLPQLGSQVSKVDLLLLIKGLELESKDHWRLIYELAGGAILEPLGGAVITLLELLFFGNRRQGLTDFVLSDLGVASYYPYSIDRENRFFTSREAVDEYIVCGDLSTTHYEWAAVRDPETLLEMARLLLRMQFKFPASKHRWYRLCNRVARDLERAKELDQALAVYKRSQLHPARERLVRVLEAQGEWQQALDQCEAIRREPWCEDELGAVGRIYPRLCKKMAKPSPARRRDHFVELRLTLPRSSSSLELASAAALRDTWAQVHYVENSLMNALFALAFWEQIFAPVPGVFSNPYQRAPRDINEQGFLVRRREEIEARFTSLKQLNLEDELLAAYKRFYGYQCSGVNWRWLPESLVAEAGRCIPSQHLLSIWRRVAFDPGENRRGFPDLIAFGDQPGAYTMIEVKGPGDKLQESQKRWLRFFQQEKIPAAVAQVTWSDD